MLTVLAGDCIGNECSDIEAELDGARRGTARVADHQRKRVIWLQEVDVRHCS